jgi:hypothetical protein
MVHTIFFTCEISDLHLRKSILGLFNPPKKFEITEGFVWELFIRLQSSQFSYHCKTMVQKKNALQTAVRCFSDATFDAEKLWARCCLLNRRFQLAHLAASNFFITGKKFNCDAALGAKKKQNIPKYIGAKLKRTTLDDVLLCNDPTRVASKFVSKYPDALLLASSRSARATTVLRKWTKRNYSIPAAATVEWMDKHHISKEAFADLRKLGSFARLLPAPDPILQEKHRLESLGPQNELKNVEVDGQTNTFAATDIEHKLTEAVAFMKNTSQLEQTPARIKVSGDGFFMRQKGWTFLQYTILDVLHPHSADANWIISLAKCDEKSEVVRQMCHYAQPILKDIETKGIQVGQTQIPIQFFLAADQKFLSILLGLKGPLNNCFCPWCEVTKEESRNGNKQGRLRTIPDLENLRSAGQEALPMLTFIPFERIVPDVMHLAMRCMEKLVVLLFSDLKSVESRKNEDAQSRFLKAVAKILDQETFILLPSRKKGSGFYKKPNFNGRQVDVLLDRIMELAIFRQNETVERRQKKIELLQLHQVVFKTLRQNKKFDDKDLALLEDQIFKWTNRWSHSFGCWVNSCHVVSQHTMFYLKRYRNIYKFSQQGVEASVRVVKKSTSASVFGNANVALEFLRLDSRRSAQLPGRVLTYKKKICPHCGREGHLRKNHKDCTFTAQKKKSIL